MKQNNINTIIFDLGGVLIDWSPEYVYLKEFRGDRVKMDWFLNHVCAWDWNVNQDAGYSLEKATQERIAMFPEYEKLIKMYYGRWEEMLGFTHEGTLNILKQLIDNPDYRVLALTNWSGETFPIALKKFPWLQWFEGILVSGDEGTRKPFRDIYDLMLDRYEIKSSEAIFIDDSLKNIQGCEVAGIAGIHFTDAKTLAVQLRSKGVPVTLQ